MGILCLYDISISPVLPYICPAGFLFCQEFPTPWDKRFLWTSASTFRVTAWKLFAGVYFINCQRVWQTLQNLFRLSSCTSSFSFSQHWLYISIAPFLWPLKILDPRIASAPTRMILRLLSNNEAPSPLDDLMPRAPIIHSCRNEFFHDLLNRKIPWYVQNLYVAFDLEHEWNAESLFWVREEKCKGSPSQTYEKALASCIHQIMLLVKYDLILTGSTTSCQGMIKWHKWAAGALRFPVVWIWGPVIYGR